MNMNMNMNLIELPRTFMVVGINVVVNCNDIEYNDLIIFFNNINSFGLHYWEMYKLNRYNNTDSSLYLKILQVEYLIDSNIHMYEATILKNIRRNNKIDSLLSE